MKRHKASRRKQPLNRRQAFQIYCLAYLFLNKTTVLGNRGLWCLYHLNGGCWKNRTKNRIVYLLNFHFVPDLSVFFLPPPFVVSHLIGLIRLIASMQLSNVFTFRFLFLVYLASACVIFFLLANLMKCF